MNVKRPLAMLVALALLTTVFAAGPAVAVQDYPDDCDIAQENNQVNALNVNADTNVNALNTAASAPVLSPGADSDAEAEQEIEDNHDSFQSQSNNAGVGC